jgi:hypothetical protein
MLSLPLLKSSFISYTADIAGLITASKTVAGFLLLGLTKTAQGLTNIGHICNLFSVYDNAGSGI